MASGQGNLDKPAVSGAAVGADGVVAVASISAAFCTAAGSTGS